MKTLIKNKKESVKCSLHLNCNVNKVDMKTRVIKIRHKNGRDYWIAQERILFWWRIIPGKYFDSQIYFDTYFEAKAHEDKWILKFQKDWEYL